MESTIFQKENFLALNIFCFIKLNHKAILILIKIIQLNQHLLNNSINHEENFIYLHLIESEYQVSILLSNISMIQQFLHLQDTFIISND